MSNMPIDSNTMSNLKESGRYDIRHGGLAGGRVACIGERAGGLAGEQAGMVGRWAYKWASGNEGR